MSRPMYTQILTPAERAQCMKLGALTKLAEEGQTKEAQGVISNLLNPANIVRTIIGVSLLGGVPLGIAAHAVGQHINKQTSDEKEMEEKIKHYRSAAQNLEQGLAT